MKNRYAFRNVKSLWILMISLFFAGNLMSQVIVDETFNYTLNSALTANGYTAHSGAGSNAIKVTGSALTYTGYPNSGIGNCITVDTTGEDVNKTFTQQTSGNVYFAMLVKPLQLKVNGDYFFHLGATVISTAFHARVFIKGDSATGVMSFGLSKNGASALAVYTPANYHRDSTYLIVIQYAFNSGTLNDSMFMWVNPTSTISTPTLTATDMAGNDLANIGTYAFRQGTNTNMPRVNLSGLRIASTWADLFGTVTPTVATPTFTPIAGTYTSAQNVTINCTTSGASIYYTLDGTTPTNASTLYSTPIAVSTTKTIKARGYKTGMDSSAVGSASYTINIPTQVATPTFSPVAGTYTSAQNVTISSTTTGATFRYTLDGTDPTSASTLYSGPIAISSTKTLKARGYFTGLDSSSVASGLYTLNLPTQVATPTFSPVAGTYTSVQNVSISSTTTGATFRYTLDGTDPTSASTLYSGPISISSTKTLKARGYFTGLDSSSVASGLYTINLPLPVPTNAWATSLSTVKVKFSKPMDTTAQNVNNYTGLGVISSAVRNTTKDTITLTLATPLIAGVNDTLYVLGVKDTLGLMMAGTVSFVVQYGGIPADTIVTWNFPSTGADLVADGGIAANLTKIIGREPSYAGTFTFTTAGVTTSSISSTLWDAGIGSKYYQVSFSTVGYNNLKFSSASRSSNTGPRNFKVQYSIGTSGLWADVSGANIAITASSSWTVGVLSNISLPDTCKNRNQVNLRWIITSDTATNGSLVASGGTSNLDNIVVTGTAGTFPDINPPSVVSAWATSLTGVKVVFSEPTDTAAQNVNNYSGLGTVSTAIRNTTKDTVTLTLQNPLAATTSYNLSINHIGDSIHNTMTVAEVKPIIFYSPITIDSARKVAEGTLVTIAGTFLTGTEFGNSISYIRDNTAAIKISYNLSAAGIARGKDIQLTGKIHFSTGQKEIDSLINYTISGTTSQPTPLPVASNGVGETHESNLVKVSQMAFVNPTGNFVLNTTYKLVKGTDTINVLISPFTNSLIGKAVPTGFVGVSGIVNQNNTTLVYSLNPRDTNDLVKEFTPDTIPPFATGVTVIDPTHVKVSFIEKMDSATAVVTSHYTGLNITLASIYPSKDTVVLTLGTALINGNSYTLTLLGLKDTSLNTQNIAQPINFLYATPIALIPGDIAFLSYRTDNDDEFSFVVLKDINENTKISFTDNAWDGTTLKTTEQVLVWTPPIGGVTKGTVVRIQGISGGTIGTVLSGGGSVIGILNLLASNGGDQLLAFTGTTTTPNFIAGISSTGWMTTGTVTSSTSYLPTTLIIGHSAIGFNSEIDNGIYTCNETYGSVSFLALSINDSINWKRNNSQDSISWTTPCTFTFGPTIIPTLITTGATTISKSTATLNGSISTSGGGVITEKGFCYSITANPTTANPKIVIAGNTIGTYSGNAINLSANTMYYVKAYAINSAGTAYGNQVTFTTLVDGIEELGTNTISFFPNPAKNSISIKNAENYTINVYSIVGQIVKQTNAKTNNYSMDISELPSGIYIMSFQYGDKKFTYRLTKQ